ncbi:MAG: type II toxin-antitoxin system VapC family toxin [Methanosarcinales archaeon]|nr:type II toxin-antitoxin system VapC family toxin [Methanosarcinales archaeon]
MKAFLDTSSLIKLYHTEVGSDFVMNAISQDIREIFLSELAILEFRSALWKKMREKEIKENTAIEVIKCFQNDGDNFHWIMLQSDIVESASYLLMKYGNRGLRTLDSLQLAAALTLRDEECVFLTSDKLLQTFFKEEQLNIL